MTTYLKSVLLVAATGTLLHLYWGTSTRDDEVTLYSHDNRNLPVVDQCTKEERSRIVSQLVLDSNTTIDFENFHKLNQKEQRYIGCYESEWLDSFFQEESNIGSEDFVGISVGCNKGTDAILAARMGMSNPKYDVPAWLGVLGNLPTLCLNKKQGEIHFPRRKGEMHCIEPMPDNVDSLNKATSELGLEREGFVVSSAAISSKNGVVKFPRGVPGTEVFSIESCDAVPTPSHCVDVNMYSLDSYVNHFVKSKGPINMLSVDTEGWDFDVLFGGSSTLDRTYYLEFEYHRRGAYSFVCVLSVCGIIHCSLTTIYVANRELGKLQTARCSEVVGWKR
jgi:FkbM family methyltransferase